MINAEGLFPVTEVENKESPVTKPKKKSKLKLSISPKSKSKAKRKDNTESDSSVESGKVKRNKGKKTDYQGSSSSEREDDQFIVDLHHITWYHRIP